MDAAVSPVRPAPSAAERWRCAAPMLVLAVAGAVLVDAAAFVAAHGLSWWALVLPAACLVPLAAVWTLTRSPTKWWEAGAFLGLASGFMGGLILSWRWPVWESMLSVLPGLALAVAGAWLTHQAGRNWEHPPAREARPPPSPHAGPFLR
ncbi:hypothetical protein [Pseudonocardia acaciae]|uniref:hypothetical protein n=1 Tax=Pseudonocardia acaciae TaxID=551276 RepID=UPI00048A7BDE|nr:hypothetical protein [Pseudonocardia acaciae]